MCVYVCMYSACCVNGYSDTISSTDVNSSQSSTAWTTFGYCLLRTYIHSSSMDHWNTIVDVKGLFTQVPMIKQY